MPTIKTFNSKGKRIGADFINSDFDGQRAKFLNLALSSYKSGKYKDAVRTIERSFAAGFKSIEILNILGASHLCLKNFENAEKIYRETISINKEFSSGYGNLGIALYEQGKVKEALSVYQAAQKLDPRNANFHTNAGNALLKLGRESDALKSYKKATNLEPRNFSAWSSFSAALVSVNKLDEAEKACRRALSINGKSPDALNNLGSIQNGKGDREGALLCFSKSLEIDPRNIQSLFSIGVLHFDVGETNLARKYWDEVLILDASHSEAYFNLGLLHQESGRLGLAEFNYTRAVYHDRNHKKAFSNFGVVKYRQGNFLEAEKLLRTALFIDDSYFDAILNLIRVLQASDKMKDALKFTQKMMKHDPSDELIIAHAMSLRAAGKSDEAFTLISEFTDKNPSDLGARLLLLSVCEGLNKVEELGVLISTLKCDGNGGLNVVRLYEAVHLLRLKKYEASLDILSTFDDQSFTGQHETMFYENLGVVQDKLNNSPKAFQAFERMNESTIQQNESFDSEVESLFNDLVLRKQDIYEYTPDRDDKISEIHDNPKIGFIVGFPRSGTTLLDTVMRSHSKISVIEEKPLVQKSIFSQFGGKLPKLKEVSDTQKSMMRKTYLEGCQAYLGEEYDSGNLIIDKLPLNLSWLPYVDMMFPGAPIIFAARHPYDSILSNYMQNFSLNPSMACMLNLKTAATLYDLSMSVFEGSVKNLDLNLHLYRYESIIADFDREVVRLLSFLELEWEDGVRDYRKTAMSRGKINTPSYKQVVQPIYKESAYRWERYKGFIHEIFPIIEPYVKKMGYYDAASCNGWEFAVDANIDKFKD
jgi:tetratricopeptide (TPR) repeat protein